jgi:hypothetical protein
MSRHAASSRNLIHKEGFAQYSDGQSSKLASEGVVLVSEGDRGMNRLPSKLTWAGRECSGIVG